MEGPAHAAAHEGTQGNFERKWDSSEIEEFSLSIVVETCKEGLVDEEVGKHSETHQCTGKRLLLVDDGTLLAILTTPPVSILFGPLHEGLDDS